MAPQSTAQEGGEQRVPGGLGAYLRRKPVYAGPDTSVRDALLSMCAERVGTVVVVDPVSLQPLGILTQRDVIERVVLEAGDLDVPVASMMTGGVIALPVSANPHQARLAMARYDLRHLVVLDRTGRFAGVVSRGDLYATSRLETEDLVDAIQTASDAVGLADAARRVREAAGVLVDQGAGAEHISEWIAILNDLIVLTAIDIAEAEFELPLVRWCWLTFGSEGRLEQTLDTDQDNGLIFAPESELEIEALRARFLPFAQRVNQLLDECGFPLCRGGVMAGNPKWCLSLGEWRGQFVEWMHSASPDGLLNASIFFDFRPLAGDVMLAVSLKDWLLAAAADNPLFLRFMAANALRSGPPLGRIRDFVVDRATGLLDLKRDGVRPFVDAARIYSLALGVGDTSTAGRLRAAGALLRWVPGETDALVDALHVIQKMRLHRQRVPGAQPNLVAPDALNELERSFLKESFRQARKLQQKLQIRYQL
jgi:CBS domain-containing protein